MNKQNEEFQRYKGLLMALSYRMLGSFIEAEDIVQEVALSWFSTDIDKIENSKAWLLRVCTNKCVDSLKKAYRKREVYTGTWLPEVLPDSLVTWENELDKKESLEVSFLLLLENLSAKERAVYILSVVFEYSSKEVAEFLEISDANSRKILQRAKEKVDKLENKEVRKKERQSRKVLKEFFDLACAGDRESLTRLLVKESSFWSDGGGKVSASRKVIHEPSRIARFFALIFKDLGHYRYDITQVNNMPGLVLSSPEENGLWKIETIFTFELNDGHIEKIFAQRNPDKLKLIKLSYSVL